MVSLFIRLKEVRNYGIYLIVYLKRPCFTVLHQTLVCVGTYVSHDTQ